MRIDGDAIDTVARRYGVTVPEFLRGFVVKLAGVPSPAEPAVALDPPLCPIVWRGAWAIECPYCRSLHRYTPGAGLSYCLNAECPRPHGAAFVAVDDWDDSLVTRVEDLLLHRTAEIRDHRTDEVVIGLDGRPALHPLIHTRSWLPHAPHFENAGDLERENRDHGHDVPLPFGGVE